MGINEIRAIKAGQHRAEREQERKDKAKKGMPAESEKTKARKAEEKKTLNGDDPAKEKWFKARRKEMVGVCQCGCAGRSSKYDDANFRSSIAHIFPKSEKDGFPSVALHPLNWVERAFWGGCHTNMDEGGLDKWPKMADWEDIKERFHILAPLLTDEERAKKFYTLLEALIYSN